MISHRTQDFELLAQQHMDALYTRAFELEAEMPRVEELVQRTFLRAFELFFSLHPGEDFKEWLFGLLDDVFYSEGRHQRAA